MKNIRMLKIYYYRFITIDLLLAQYTVFMLHFLFTKCLTFYFYLFFI